MAGRDALLPVGFTQPPPSLTVPVRSYRTFSPLPCAYTAPKRKWRHAAVYFLLHLPAGYPGLLLATTVLCGVRTFLGPRLAPGRGPVRRNAFTRSAHSRLLVYPSALKCPTSLKRCRTPRSSKNSTSLREARPKKRWRGVCGPESRAWRMKDLIGLTWETASTVLPS